MHFRVRGNSVQLVKTQEVDGKMASTPAGSANLSDGKLNDKANELLSDQEKREVIAWIAARKNLNRKDFEVKSAMLAEHIASIAKAVKQGLIDMSEEDFKSVQTSVRQLKNAAIKKK